MKAIETLFNLELGRFDTPKKINRSNNVIPIEVIESLEKGEFTHETLTDLVKRFPVFRYRSCITVHGSWPMVEVTRIGGYRNVIQNKNGSVEVRYTAIDVEKFHRIADLIYQQSKFRLHSDSNGRKFQIAQRVTKETYKELGAQFNVLAAKFKGLDIYGNVSVYLAQDFFGLFLVLDVVPLAIPESQVNTLTELLTGKPIAELNSLLAERKEVERIENEAREKERAERSAAYQVAVNEAKAKVNALDATLAHYPIVNGSGFKVGQSYIKAFATTDLKPTLAIYRIEKNGSFGRVQWSKATVNSIDETPVFIEKKQQKLSEFKTTNFRLFTL